MLAELRSLVELVAEHPWACLFMLIGMLHLIETIGREIQGIIRPSDAAEGSDE